VFLPPSVDVFNQTKMSFSSYVVDCQLRQVEHQKVDALNEKQERQYDDCHRQSFQGLGNEFWRKYILKLSMIE